MIIISLIALFFSIVLHEIAHGAIAFYFGDDTAFKAGRLSLNPIKHVDPIGTIALPILLLLSGSKMLFGWAKPVPISMEKLKEPKKNILWVAIGGPLTNFFLAIIFLLLLKFLYTLAEIILNIPEGKNLLFYLIDKNPSLIALFKQSFQIGIISFFMLLAFYGIIINIILGTFNLIPIPPLDGSRILYSLLPDNLATSYNQIEKYGMLIIIGLIYFNILNPILKTVYNFALSLVF
jgi:Zn-dependent protease